MLFKILSVTSPISSISISRNIARVIHMISMVHRFIIFYKFSHFSSLTIYLGPCLNIITVDNEGEWQDYLPTVRSVARFWQPPKCSMHGSFLK